MKENKWICCQLTLKYNQLGFRMVVFVGKGVPPPTPFYSWFMFKSLMTTSPFILLLVCFLHEKISGLALATICLACPLVKII
jgi:hypothetical protein